MQERRADQPRDIKRARGWLAGLNQRTPALPGVVHVNGVAGTGDELLALVKEELGYLGGATIKLGGDDGTASYDDPPLETLVAELHVPAGAKLRSIRIAQSKTNELPDATITEGLEIHLVYDDHDQLLAVDASHFLWD